MRIGWIGAGKVGSSLGRYFTEHGIAVSGYYSRRYESAAEAAAYTKTRAFETMEALVEESDVLFLTVPDGAIAQVWEGLKEMNIRQKVICHCSGVLSSEIFSNCAVQECSGCSIHPLLAVSSRRLPTQELSSAIFTIEGDEKAVGEIGALVRSCGNTVIPIRAEEKPRYHAAAVLASNLVLSLAAAAQEELVQCGFSEKEALAALAPLMQANTAHLSEQSLEDALTGPVERGDADTVRRHLTVLSGDDRAIYELLSRKALVLAGKKHPQRDYEELKELLV